VKQYLVISYLLFILIMYVHLISLIHPKNIWRGRTKALLMPSLLLLYLMQAQYPSLLIALALLCSFLGDVGLQQSSKRKGNLETYSIILFGFAHIFYIIYFIQALSPYTFSPIHIIPYLCAALLLLYLYLQKRIRTSIQIIYAVIISCMAASSCLYMVYYTTPHSMLVFTGASLFIFSDFLIARQMNEGHKKDEIAIMATYILAQFLIIVGIIG